MSNKAEFVAKLEAVREHMPNMKRADLERAQLAYCAFYLNIMASVNELIAALPDESDDPDEDVKFWGPTL